jgi:hypothetical protein
MANTDNRFGLRLIESRRNHSFRKAYVNSTYATDVFVGDCVTRAATAIGNAAEITTASGSYGIGSLEDVIRVTPGTGNPIYGVITSIDAPIGVATNYGIASTDRVVTICVDEQAEYEIQAEGTFAATQLGLNAVLIDTHTGSTVYGLSGTELDSGTTTAPAADAAYQLTVISLMDRDDNEAGTNAKLRVRVNNSSNAHATVGEA